MRTLRAWRIDAVYLFDAQGLLAEQRARGVKIGVASGVRRRSGKRPKCIPPPRMPP